MANTKKLDRAARREAKKEMRHKNAELYAKLTKAERKKWRKFDEGGFKLFLAKLEQERAGG
ncbi:MAG: hypothetical protein JXR96_08260 [Deltaproteobacteria bacterium]|nr:hypothetical protein [Deltaproteobacteria bacterium]